MIFLHERLGNMKSARVNQNLKLSDFELSEVNLVTFRREQIGISGKTRVIRKFELSKFELTSFNCSLISLCRKRSAFHVTSSTSSSEAGSSDDEEHFQKRKAKSMAKARSTMLPMNMKPEDVASSTLMRDRIRAGASMADVDPMSIDRSVCITCHFVYS